jgi:hypothetical protein
MRSLFLWRLTLLRNLDPLINQTVNRAAIFIIAATFVVVLAACKATPASAPSGPPPEPVAKGPTDEPSKELPKDLFPSMPIYPGAKVEHIRKPKGAMREILLSSDSTMQQMVGYYKEELKKNDFHITSSLIMPARRTWSCDFHYNGRPGSIMLYPSDQDKTKMTIDLIYELPAHIDESLMEPKEDFDIEGPGEMAQQQAPNSNPSEKEKRN